jgi:hypothetical protein
MCLLCPTVCTYCALMYAPTMSYCMCLLSPTVCAYRALPCAPTVPYCMRLPCPTLCAYCALMYAPTMSYCMRLPSPTVCAYRALLCAPTVPYCMRLPCPTLCAYCALLCEPTVCAYCALLYAPTVPYCMRLLCRTVCTYCALMYGCCIWGKVELPLMLIVCAVKLICYVCCCVVFLAACIGSVSADCWCKIQCKYELRSCAVFILYSFMFCSEWGCDLYVLFCTGRCVKPYDVHKLRTSLSWQLCWACSLSW